MISRVLVEAAALYIVILFSISELDNNKRGYNSKATMTSKRAIVKIKA